MNEEKKLTDEEIVKALEFCAKDSSCLWDSKCPLRNDKDCHVTLSKAALAFINRQNKDYIELDLECRELRTELDKELAEHEEFTKKAKAEIERLTEERDVYLDDCSAVRHKIRQEIEEKFELQKQVDELTDKLGKVLSGIKADELLVAKGVEQAVKDTAKEICDLILEHWEKKQFVECDWLRVTISERYGVEVE